MRSLAFIVTVTILATSFGARAQVSPCAAYFQQHIHDKLVVIDNKTNTQVSSSTLCQNSAENSASGFSISYAGIGIGFDQASALARSMCDKKFSQSDFESNNTAYSSIVDPSILAAANECFKLNARGLHYDVHSDADTHSVTIAMLYDGPTGISLTDIVLDGNAKCEGELFKEWSSVVESSKKIPLDTKTRTLTCVPKDSIDLTKTADIAAGSISIATDAGPIYAQIPRRFAPTLEMQFEALKGQVASIQKTVALHNELLSNFDLATAIVAHNQIVYGTTGVTYDAGTGVFTFPNPKQLRFVPLITDSQRGQSTTIHFIKEIIPPNQVRVYRNPLDTQGGRDWPATDFTLVILAHQ